MLMTRVVSGSMTLYAGFSLRRATLGARISAGT
jgi:hypothetical protein